MTTFADSELLRVAADQPLYELGQTVKVIYTSPHNKLRPTYSRVMHYLGTVAARPEDKSSQLLYTERRGGIDVLDIELAPTYTINTAVQTMIEKERLDCGTLQIIETDLSPADLILDLSNGLYKMRSVETNIPLPRQV